MGLFDDSVAKEPTPPAAPARPATRYGVSLDLREDKVFLTAGESQDFGFILKNTGTGDDSVLVRIETLPPLQEKASEAAEWGVKLTGILPRGSWDVTFSREFEKELDLIPNGEREVTLTVTCPRGARYGDQLQVIVNLSSKADPVATDSRRVTATARQAILAVKTSIGYERVVTDSMAARAKARDVGIFSILAPDNSRGYIYVESMNPDRLEELARSIRRAGKIVGGQAKMDDITHYLTPKPLVSGIMEGDIVELVAGPFKGEKARVQKIDEAKEEITVELFEAMVPIPVTVRGDNVRVLAKEEK